MSQFINPDADLESILDRLHLQQLHKLTCDNHKTIQRICINPLCTNTSLICNDLACPVCNQKAHQSCQSVKLQAITSALSARTERQKEFFLSICDLENYFFNELEKARAPLVERHKFGDLELKYVQVVRQIYEKDNSKCLQGQQALSFYNRVKLLKVEVPNQHSKRILSEYQKALQQILADIIKLRDSVFKNFEDEKQVQTKKGSFFSTPFSSVLTSPYLPSSYLSTKQPILQENKSTIRSQSTFLDKQIELLRQLLDEPIKMERIFKASQNNFSIRAFHQVCDNIEDTVVLVHTQFGKTIGGYTHHPWTSEGKWVSDPQGRSFLFSLDMNEKFHPNQTKYLILCHQEYGPVFGFHEEGNDLCIGDRSNIKQSSYSNFPEAYNRIGKKLAKNQETIQLFSGVAKGIYFKVTEWEVFQISFKS